MHDPQSVAFEIKNPFVKDRYGYRPSLITIWHCDPEKDGSDDSCGWFIRGRHIYPRLMDKVKKEFEFNYKHNYWFDKTGKPKFSNIGLAVEMYTRTSWILAMYLCGDKPTDKARNIHKRFMRKHLYEIISFAENPNDCLFQGPVMLNHNYDSADWYASIVLADIMRKRRPWYKHPRWHIHHWRLQIHPWQQLKRRYWDKCEVCGKRGFTGSSAISYNKGIAHEHCWQKEAYKRQTENLNEKR